MQPKTSSETVLFRCAASIGATSSGCWRRQKLDDVPALLLVRNALRHARATHHSGRVGNKVVDGVRRPSDARILESRRVVEALDGARGPADHALQGWADAVARLRHLVAGAALPLEEHFSAVVGALPRTGQGRLRHE
jgi:hypothetical protein